MLNFPITTRRSKQSILKEISPGISLEGMMLKLKLQYFGHLMRRVDSLEMTLMLGGIEARRRRGRQRMRWLDGITDSMDVSLGELGSWWWTGRPGMLQFMGSQRVGHDWATELNWTECMILLELLYMLVLYNVYKMPRMSSINVSITLLLFLSSSLSWEIYNPWRTSWGWL